MSRTKLSQTQIRALAKLSIQSGPQCSYHLNYGLNTLEALEQRGYVKSRRGVGSFYSPRTAIDWRITEEGLKALNEATDGDVHKILEEAIKK